MITANEIKIFKNCEFGGSARFRIELVVPGEIGALLGVAAVEIERNDYHATMIEGMMCDCWGFDADEDGLAIGDFGIDGVGLHVERQDDGSFLFSMSCEKLAEGDDQLDTWSYEEAMTDKLPENFWIEPAFVIRKLMAASKH
jgi:hypothetical protein